MGSGNKVDDGDAFILVMKKGRGRGARGRAQAREHVVSPRVREPRRKVRLCFDLAQLTMPVMTKAFQELVKTETGLGPSFPKTDGEILRRLGDVVIDLERDFNSYQDDVWNFFEKYLMGRIDMLFSSATASCEKTAEIEVIFAVDCNSVTHSWRRILLDESYKKKRVEPSVAAPVEPSSGSGAGGAGGAGGAAAGTGDENEYPKDVEPESAHVNVFEITMGSERYRFDISWLLRRAKEVYKNFSMDMFCSDARIRRFPNLIAHVIQVTNKTIQVDSSTQALVGAEADDIIARVCLREPDCRTVIFSNDGDYITLLGCCNVTLCDLDGNVRDLPEFDPSIYPLIKALVGKGKKNGILRRPEIRILRGILKAKKKLLLDRTSQLRKNEWLVMAASEFGKQELIEFIRSISVDWIISAMEKKSLTYDLTRIDPRIVEIIDEELAKREL